MLSQAMSFLLSMLNTVVLARLLVPEDFGIIGMVTVFINFLIMFKDAGLSTATIQRETISKEQISTLFWINGLISLFLGITILLASPLVALFYRKPELTAVTAVLSLSFILQGFIIQHIALLRRHLLFTTIAINDILAQICNILVAIVLAYLGARYWALVGGSIAMTITLVLLTFYSCPWRPGGLKKGAGVRDMLRFGGHITASYFVGYLARNLDRLLIGRFIGAAPLGLYTRAYTLLMQPLTQVRAPLINLSLPVLSSLNNNPQKYLGYFNKLLDISISLALPISVYCFLESDFLIRLLLGEKWMDAAPIFKILSVGGVFVAMSAAPGVVMLSRGHSKRYFNVSLITALVYSISFIIGIPFGIKGIATAYTASSILAFIPLIHISFKDTPVTKKDVFAAIIGPLLASFSAGALTFLFLNSFEFLALWAHIAAFFIFLSIYVVLTLLRTQTRTTLLTILRNIYSGFRNE